MRLLIRNGVGELFNSFKELLPTDYYFGKGELNNNLIRVLPTRFSKRIWTGSRGDCIKLYGGFR